MSIPPGLEYRLSLIVPSAPPQKYAAQEFQVFIVTLFNNYYGEHFELIDRESVFKGELFGKGQPHPASYNFIGDFIAIAKDVYCLYASNEITPEKFVAHKGHHAGGTKEEMAIDISVFND